MELYVFAQDGWNAGWNAWIQASPNQGAVKEGEQGDREHRVPRPSHGMDYNQCVPGTPSTCMTNPTHLSGTPVHCFSGAHSCSVWDCRVTWIKHWVCIYASSSLHLLLIHCRHQYISPAVWQVDDFLTKLLESRRDFDENEQPFVTVWNVWRNRGSDQK